ncbi:MAG: prepilin-type N-terminal cleavage/methylation domain-containing protein [Leucobacter sp.]|nr:prepilin-type N-terminal cleavage/methylation domain-containing protein [Leucobacter sp.]
MIERIQAVLRDRKQDDKGFSLIELAIVIVVIGILVAIAIPVFTSLAGNAEEAQLKAAASNGASMVASELAANPGTALADLNTKLAGLVADKVTSVTVDNTDLADFCVSVNGGTAEKGPGC